MTGGLSRSWPLLVAGGDDRAEELDQLPHDHLVRVLLNEVARVRDPHRVRMRKGLEPGRSGKDSGVKVGSFIPQQTFT
jgi:hypothetical protein